MTRLLYPDGRIELERGTIESSVAAVGARLRLKQLPGEPGLAALLDAPVLDQTGQDALLGAIDAHLVGWLPIEGQTGRDLVVFHENLPDLAELRRKFLAFHSHVDDEVRYIVAGTGYFGFVASDGSQFLLEVGAGDLLNVPRGAEHWFTLGADSRLKAVRYFGSISQWTALPSSRKIHPALLTLAGIE